MSLTVVVGPMFSGKTTWIHQYIQRNSKIGRKCLVVRPNISSRYSNETSERWTTHDGSQFEAKVVAMEMPLLQSIGPLDVDAYDTLVIDEAQFCTGISELVYQWVDVLGRDLVLVGLPSDFRRKPFIDSITQRPEFLEALATAETVIHLKALCTQCKDGTPGLFTYRKPGHGSSIVLVGSSNTYEALCRKHFYASS